MQDVTPDQIVDHRLPVGTIYTNWKDLPTEGYAYCHGQVIPADGHDFPIDGDFHVPDMREVPIIVVEDPDDPDSEVILIRHSIQRSNWVIKVRDV